VRIEVPSASRPSAWVVFSGEAPLWWLRCLRPGFRHCFVVLNDGERWILVDPLAPHTEVRVLDRPALWDVPGWYRGRGHAVVRAAVRRDRVRVAPPAPFTCVEAVKRVIGLADPAVLTPWQLYRRLASPSPSPIRQEDPPWEA
jgi:hypothetical protein